ncbi:MAG: hypothetical protein LQ349_006158 [Xanthoria aureola]|nr:MAG: hypothetical protein LQ349_006158 [Xanthoria aureola]
MATQSLIAAWSEVLDMDESEIDGEDSFFEIGGDSVKSIRLIGAAREVNLDVDAETIFRHPTLSAMAEHCKKLDGISHSASEPELALDQGLLRHCALACHVDPTCIEDIVPSTKMQTALFEVHISAEKPGVMQKQIVFNIEGTDDASSVMAAFQAVRDKNQVLRTRLVQHEGCVMQVILRDDQVPWERASDLAEYLERDVCIKTNFGDPLTRYAVVHDDSEKKTFLVWTVLHCVEDEWTRNLVLDGIEQYLLSPTTYSKKSKPPTLRMFANHMSSNLNDGAAFWQNYMADPPIITRPSLWKVPENYQPGHFTWIAEQQRRISFNSHEHGGISLATVAHGAFGLAFAAMSGNLDDAVFAVSRSGRQMPLKGIESMMRPMLCTVPLRIRPASHDTVLDMLQQIQADSIPMMAYEQLARETLPPLRNDLPELNWHMNDMDTFRRKIIFRTEGGIKASVKPDKDLTPEFDYNLPLYVEARSSNGFVKVEAGYDGDLLERSLVRRFVDLFLDILESMVRRSLEGTVEDMLVGKTVKKTEIGLHATSGAMDMPVIDGFHAYEMQAK